MRDYDAAIELLHRLQSDSFCTMKPAFSFLQYRKMRIMTDLYSKGILHVSRPLLALYTLFVFPVYLQKKQ